MLKKIYFVAFSLLIMLAASKDTLLTNKEVFTLDGDERAFYVRTIPSSTELPVIIMIHGYTGTALGFEEIAGLADLGTQNGYIVAVVESN